MAEIGVTQQDLAESLGMNSTTLNLYLNGRRKPPSDFEERVTAALDKLERAERAASEARQRVLAGEGAA